MGTGTPVPKDLRSAYDSARAHLSAELEPPARRTSTAPTVAARDD
jgi:hypothetical protein